MRTIQPGLAAVPFNPVSAIGRMPTGTKVLLILSAALLPLALIGVYATLQITRTADLEARAQLRVAAAEAARAVTIELLGDATALSNALSALDQDPGNALACARARGLFVDTAARYVQFVIYDDQRKILCGTPMPRGLAVPEASQVGPPRIRLLPGQGLVLGLPGESPSAAAAAFFPTPFLANLARPSGFVPEHAAALVRGDLRIELTALEFRNSLERRETTTIDLGIDDLKLEMSVRAVPITSSLIVALALPILMWLFAAAMAWLVVDRLLIRPLRRLRTDVAAYSPGEIIDPAAIRQLPAAEIRELGDTFRAISRTVALHEADLAAGLVRQTKLTREVHHRVKNNLQVIASLINFHSRSANGAEAAAAYTSIQRRVDALSVVHRHHHAETEERTGLPLRGMLGELTQTIRATAPAASANMSITLDVGTFAVNQDTAAAIAFLVTELIELATEVDPAAAIRIATQHQVTDGKVSLSVTSPALADSSALADALEQRYGRVIQGLSRQLRGDLNHDGSRGSYEIAVSVMAD